MVKDGKSVGQANLLGNEGDETSHNFGIKRNWQMIIYSSPFRMNSQKMDCLTYEVSSPHKSLVRRDCKSIRQYTGS